MTNFIKIILFSFIMTNNVWSQSTFSAENIKKSLIDYIKDNSNEDIEVEFLTPIETVRFKDSKISATIINKKNSNGIINLQIQFKDESKNIKLLDVRARIIEYIKVPYATRNIPKNTLITLDDFDYKSVPDNNSNRNNKYSDVYKLMGKKSSRYITKGDIIQNDYVLEEKIIKRGDKVIVVVQVGAVSVKTVGTALENGNEGEIIKVSRDSSTKKILQGTVQPDATILINVNNQGYTDAKYK